MLKWYNTRSSLCYQSCLALDSGNNILLRLNAGTIRKCAYLYGVSLNYRPELVCWCKLELVLVCFIFQLFTCLFLSALIIFSNSTFKPCPNFSEFIYSNTRKLHIFTICSYRLIIIVFINSFVDTYNHQSI